MLAEPLRSGCHANERRRRSACPACAADDLVLRDFAPSAANQLRAAEDVKYVPTAAGWLSTAAVVDCFSCRVVGWSMRDGSRAQPGRRRARDGRRAPTTPTGRPNERLSTETGAVQRLQPGRSNDFSRLAYVEVLADERAQSAVGLLGRALAWFAAQGCGSSA